MRACPRLAILAIAVAAPGMRISALPCLSGQLQVSFAGAPPQPPDFLPPNFFPASGGILQITVGKAGPIACDWAASSTAAWLVLSGQTSGNGDGAFVATILANSGPARDASIMITGNGGIPVLQRGACQVNVLRLSQCQGKQNNPPHWGGEVYDSSDATMCGKGCATTSLSVALLNQRISVFPVLGVPELNDPGHLNDFIRQYPGDYDANHNLVFRYAVRDVGLSTGQKLRLCCAQFNGSSDPVDLAQALCQGQQPVIVGVKHCDLTPCKKSFPCHYVLVTGKDGDDFSIADPCGNPHTKLSEYGAFIIRGYVTDPPADNSELALGVDDSAELLVTDSTGQRTGFDPMTGILLKEILGSDYARDSLDDDETDEAATGVTHSLGIFQPAPGPYTAVLTGLKLGVFTLTIRGFSADGSAQPPIVTEGIAGPSSTSRFKILFASTPNAGSEVARIATFLGTLADISNSFELGLIDSGGIANSLSQKIRGAQNAGETTKNNILNAFKNEVNAQAGKHITGAAVQVFLQDADSLIGQSP